MQALAGEIGDEVARFGGGIEAAVAVVREGAAANGFGEAGQIAHQRVLGIGLAEERRFELRVPQAHRDVVQADDVFSGAPFGASRIRHQQGPRTCQRGVERGAVVFRQCDLGLLQGGSQCAAGGRHRLARLIDGQLDVSDFDAQRRGRTESLFAFGRHRAARLIDTRDEVVERKPLGGRNDLRE